MSAWVNPKPHGTLTPTNAPRGYLEDDFERQVDLETDMSKDIAWLLRMDPWVAAKTRGADIGWLEHLGETFVDSVLDHTINWKRRSAYSGTVFVPGRIGPDEIVALNNKRDSSGGDLTTREWRLLAEHYGRVCPYCQRDSQRIQLEHIRPISAGGLTTLDNVLPACRDCNSNKGAKPLERWLGAASAAAIKERHAKIVSTIRGAKNDNS